MAAARRMAAGVWERGLLRKGLGLCHGVGGNGYVFLSLYRATGEEKYLQYARAFAVFIVENLEAPWPSDHPFSLYEGMAGGVHFLMDCLEPKEAAFPGYE